MEGLTIATDPPDERGGPQRRTRLVVSIGIGAIVLLLTAGVTTVSLSGQRLAANSAAVHLFDEIMRSATLMQAELAIGLTLTDLTETAGVDAADSTANAFAGAASSRANLASALSMLEDHDAEVADVARSALEPYLALADSLGEREEAATRELTELDEAFTAAVSTLADERERVADRARESDRDLALVSRLISFLTAFVVPSAGVVVYRLLAVPRRELLQTEAALARERHLADLRVKLGSQRLAEVETRLGRAAFPAARAVEVDLARTRKALVAINGSQRSSFEPVDVDTLLADVAASLDASSSEASSDFAAAAPPGRACPTIEWEGADGLVVRTDRLTAEALFASICAYVARGGGDSVRCNRSVADDEVLVDLTIPLDSGPASILRALDQRSSIEERLDRLDHPDELELMVMIQLADSLGLRLSTWEAANGGLVLRIALPSAEPGASSIIADPGRVRAPTPV